MNAWDCAALGRSAAEKGGPYLTTDKMVTEEYPFWNIITESGSGLNDSCLLKCVSVIDYAHYSNSVLPSSAMQGTSALLEYSNNSFIGWPCSFSPKKVGCR